LDVKNPLRLVEASVKTLLDRETKTFVDAHPRSRQLF